MEKAVLLSTNPVWCDKMCTAIGHDEKFNLIYEKMVEIRKTRPKLETPFKVYIYCTLQGSNEFFQSLKNRLGEYEALSKWNREKWGLKKGKVIGEFVCDSIRKISCTNNNEGVWLKSTAGEFILGMSALTHDEISSYLEISSGYAWHISNLVIYDEPRELREFCKVGVCPCDAKSILHCTENMSFCAKRNLIIAPQSWCYVEEIS